MKSKMQKFIDKLSDSMQEGLEKFRSFLQDKNTLKKLGIMILALILLIVIFGLVGWLIMQIYRFINDHMGELTIIAISIGMVFAWLQSNKDERVTKRRKEMEEQHKALKPKANATYQKLATFMTDILQDKSHASLIGLARPSNTANVIMENPAQQIQFKPDGSGYLLTYRADKLSLTGLNQEQLFTIRDVLQGAINQRIAAYGINGLCPPKQNTFLYIMGIPSDCQTYITFSLDYDEGKLRNAYNEAPVYGIANDRDYGN